jgi:hypothetical protein
VREKDRRVKCRAAHIGHQHGTSVEIVLRFRPHYRSRIPTSKNHLRGKDIPRGRA